jgi:hypothetical protein
MTRSGSKSEFVSAAGTMLEIFLALQKLGATDDDWRRILSDPDVAADVYAALRRHKVVGANATLADVIAAGNFGATSALFSSVNLHRWSPLGDHARGALQSINMRLPLYSPAEALLEAARIPGLYVANGYELALYAQTQWNGQDFVIAFGSEYADSGRFPLLAPGLDGCRVLDASVGVGVLPAHFLVLCVQTDQPAAHP